MTEPAHRPGPPAQLAKIATAGATGVFVLGLTAVMGWADRPSGEPAVVPVTLPPSTAVVQTTTLLPLATTVPTAPVPAPVPVAPAPAAPAPPPVAVTAPPPAPPVIVVSEQSQ
jgi:hypothetical protein